MRLPDYEPQPIEDWYEFGPDFIYTISQLLQEVEVERRHHVGGYLFTQDLTAEYRREQRLAELSAVTIKGLMDMLSGVPEWNVQPELDRILGGESDG